MMSNVDDHFLSEGDDKINEGKQRYYTRMKRRSVSLDDINVTALEHSSASSSTSRQDKLPVIDPSSQSSNKFKGLKKKLSVRLSQNKSSGELLSRNDLGSDGSKLAPPSSKLDTTRSLPEDLKQAIRERRRRSKEKSASADYSSGRQNNEIFDKNSVYHHGSLDSYDHQLSGESSIIIKCEYLDDINNSPYETDEPDGFALADQQLEKLWKKIEKTKEDLTHQQAMKDENVSTYLKTNNNPSETGINVKMKLNFERNNQKTNMNIQLLQKKLEKYQQQVKEIEENGVPGTKRIMRVMQNSVRSGTSSIADAVSKPLESFNNFIKKEKKSSSIENIDCNLTDDDESEAKGIYSFQHTTSDEDVFVNSKSMAHATLMENVCGIGRDDMCSLKTSLEKIELENKESKESIDLFKDALSRVLQSLQEERYKTEQLQSRLNDLFNQWNDLTELHQNEMLGMKEEMDRTLENIECVEYRFTERTADLQEEVENCITRISKMEKQQQDQQPMETILDMDAKILLSKFLSFIINICVVVLFIISSMSKLVLPFVSSRTRLIVSIFVFGLYILWKNYSYHDLFCYYQDLFLSKQSSV